MGSRTTLCAIGLALAACADEPRPPAPRNVLLVTLDTTRADHLGCYGMRPGVTPCVDRLAAQGVVFEQAMTPVPITLPAHASLLTGSYPPYHGVHDNGTFTLVPECTSLAEILSGEGFATGAFVAARVLDRRYGLAQGFDAYEDVPRTPDASGRYAVELSATQVVDRALAWLALHEAEPFFAWVHLFDPHSPYTPPPTFRERFPGEAYLAEIAFADSQLARLESWLVQSGQLDDTLVIVTADHGEGLGEHGEETHSLLVYEPTLHVPLVMRHASLTAGTRVTTPASLVDVLPTVLGRLHRAPPAEAQGIDLFDPRAMALERELYFETEFPLHNFGWSALRGTRDGSLKYTSAPRPELFDLDPDPHEASNLLERESPRAAELESALESLRRSLAEGGSDATSRLELSAQAARDLESLGYVSAPDSEEPGAALVDPKDRIQYAGRVINLWTTYAGGDLEKARRDAEAVLAENPRIVLAWETLGSMTMQEARTLKAAGAVEQAEARFLEALEQFDQALALDAARVDSLLQKGVVLRQLGRAAEAAAAFARCVELQPDNAMPHRWLGLHLEATGEAARAAQHYSRFLELWPPGDRLAQDTRRRLEDLRRDG